jgi:2'-5' RNA ligase
VDRDLFPQLLLPEALGFQALTLMAPAFFAIRPDEIASAKITERQPELCERAGLKPSASRPASLFHISIAPWGSGKRLCQPYEAALDKAKEQFSFPAFDVTLTCVTRFNAGDGQWALVLEADAETAGYVHALRKALADTQQLQGLSAPRGAFRPHVTIAYGRDIPDETLPIEPIRFRAKHVEMIVSNWGKGEHIHLDRWELQEVDSP